MILVGATGHYTDTSVPNPFVPTSGGGEQDPWVAPLGFLLLGFFLALVGLVLARRRAEPETT